MVKKNMMKILVNNTAKIGKNLGKLTMTAVAIAYVTPKSKDIGKETVELIAQQARLIRNMTMGK